jgi:hypothetical protein
MHGISTTLIEIGYEILLKSAGPAGKISTIPLPPRTTRRNDMS